MRAATETDWHRLAGTVRGRVFLPGDAGHRVHSDLFNRRYRDRRPAAVVCVADTADVQRAIAWAREHGVPLVARSTGHSFAGHSVNDGLVIDLNRLSLAHADESTGLVTVGGGARAGQLYAATRPYEIAVPVGTNPIVGMGGLTLGGGAEFASRRFGLTCDCLVETVLVTPDCQVLTCSSAENADLFWACRGGGGGNFGINVSFTFQAHPVPDVTTFSLTWEWPDAANVLDCWQRLVAAAPDDFSVSLGASTAGSNAAAAARSRTVTAAGQFFGSACDLDPILDPLLSTTRPTSRTVVERTFWEAKTHLMHATAADAFALRTRYVTELISAEGLAAMLSQVERWPGSGSEDGGGIGLFSWGGQINRVAPDDTAFAHRDTLFLASMHTAWGEDNDPAVVDANLRWLNDFHDAMSPYLSGASYQNFLDPELTDWRRAYYGANYPRLAAIKKAVDPDRVFDFEQAIR
jgi:FAD/FMN-containing dehydrogenase